MFKRYLTNDVIADFTKKMVFIGGPRQIGKTTFALSLLNNGDATSQAPPACHLPGGRGRAEGARSRDICNTPAHLTSCQCSFSFDSRDPSFLQDCGPGGPLTIPPPTSPNTPINLLLSDLSSCPRFRLPETPFGVGPPPPGGYPRTPLGPAKSKKIR